MSHSSESFNAILRDAVMNPRRVTSLTRGGTLAEFTEPPATGVANANAGNGAGIPEQEKRGMNSMIRQLMAGGRRMD